MDWTITYTDTEKACQQWTNFLEERDPEIMLYEYVVIKSGEDFDDDPQLLVNPSTVFAHDDEEAKLLAMYSLAKNLPDVDPKSVEILVRPFARD